MEFEYRHVQGKNLNIKLIILEFIKKIKQNYVYFVYYRSYNKTHNVNSFKLLYGHIIMFIFCAVLYTSGKYSIAYFYGCTLYIYMRSEKQLSK